MLPATVAPPAPETARVNVPGAVIVTGSMASLKVALTALFNRTLISAFAGLVRVIVGGVVSGAAPVVKLHGSDTAPAIKALPARSFAAFVIVAVNCVLAARFAVGVKVATTPA